MLQTRIVAAFAAVAASEIRKLIPLRRGETHAGATLTVSPAPPEAP